VLFRSALAALVAASLSADVTIRYQTQVKMNPALPPQVAAQALKGFNTAMPPETLMQFKEGKGAANLGGIRTITDLVKKQVTMIDPDHKQFSVSSMDELADALGKSMAELPSEAKAAMAQMKFATDAKVTGRTETIKGIPAAEREITLTMDGPMGQMVKMTFDFWGAKEEDVNKVPELQELKGYNVWTYQTMNPAAAIERMFQAMPGMGDGLATFIKEMQSAKSMLVRSDVKMWMPIMATLAKQLPAEQNPFGKDFDFSAPFLEIQQELGDISAAPVPATAFVVPEGYTSVPAADIVRAILDRAKQAAGQK